MTENRSPGTVTTVSTPRPVAIPWPRNVVVCGAPCPIWISTAGATEAVAPAPAISFTASSVNPLPWHEHHIGPQQAEVVQRLDGAGAGGVQADVRAALRAAAKSATASSTGP